MNYYYITGTSRGIGKALAEFLLKDKNNHVTGISRTNLIKHANYNHITLDLSKFENVEQFSFHNYKDAGRVVLVNNAGFIGEIKRTGNHKNRDIADTFAVNLTAPSILINKFIDTYRNSPAEKIILNISSGAGRRPIDAASAYSASKAGLDMFSRTVAEEQKITGHDFNIASISVGVVDTVMQSKLREADENEFSRRAEFIGYKENGQIQQPEYVAQRLVEIMDEIDKVSDVVFSIREFDNMNIE
jgi:benzil reductase ((S)-benzoin forming)